MERATPVYMEVFGRGHRGIENKMHDVRNAAMGEDGGQGDTGGVPQALAAIRNANMSLPCAAGADEHRRRPAQRLRALRPRLCPERRHDRPASTRPRAARSPA